MFKRLSRRAIGQHKEQQAKKWLKNQGVTIIAENYHCKGGEIDLIGLDEYGLVFFEVKYRRSNRYGEAMEMVNHYKQQHIIRCAQYFLLKHPQYHQHAMRFDVVSFTDNTSEPQWLQNAFQTD